MNKYYPNDAVLKVDGYEIHFTRFADSILKDHFAKAKNELEKVLDQFYIPESDIVKGGGGLSQITQHLSKLFEVEGWEAETLKSTHYVITKNDGNKRLVSSQEYDLDHFNRNERGNIGLKIQWNSKDTVFHSNLDDLKQLYQLNELSIGIVITKGESLQLDLFFVYQRFLQRLSDLSPDRLQKELNLSTKASKDIAKMVKKDGDKAIPRIAKYMVSSKFGAATTHMDKLLPYVNGGTGDPCPLILIGIGKKRLKP